MIKKVLLTGFVIILLTSCGAYLNKNVNPYYFGMTTIDPQIYKKSKDVSVYQYKESNVKYFLERGYVLKAKSAFRERYVHPDWPELAAKQMGATVMLLDKEYVGSVSGRRNLVWRVPGDTYKVTSNTSGNISYDSNTDAYLYTDSGYGYGNSTTTGNVNYNSSTTTTVQGPDSYRTTTVAYQNHYYDHYAVFMVKKYYWADTDIKYYSDSKLTNYSGTIKAGEWFRLSLKKKKYRRLLYNGKMVYTGRPENVKLF